MERWRKNGPAAYDQSMKSLATRLQFKTVRVTVFLDDGPPVAQESGSMAEAAGIG